MNRRELLSALIAAPLAATVKPEPVTAKYTMRITGLSIGGCFRAKDFPPSPIPNVSREEFYRFARQMRAQMYDEVTEKFGPIVWEEAV